MVIDASVLLAILLGEPEAVDFAKAIAGDPKRLVSAISALEAGIVIQARKGAAGARELDLLIHAAGLTIVSLDAEQVLLARGAYARSARESIPQALIGEIAAAMHWRVPQESLSCSRATIFRRRTS